MQTFIFAEKGQTAKKRENKGSAKKRGRTLTCQKWVFWVLKIPGEMPGVSGIYLENSCVKMLRTLINDNDLYCCKWGNSSGRMEIFSPGRMGIFYMQNGDFLHAEWGFSPGTMGIFYM